MTQSDAADLVWAPKTLENWTVGSWPMEPDGLAKACFSTTWRCGKAYQADGGTLMGRREPVRRTQRKMLWRKTGGFNVSDRTVPVHR